MHYFIRYKGRDLLSAHLNDGYWSWTVDNSKRKVEGKE